MPLSLDCYTWPPAVKSERRSLLDRACLIAMERVGKIALAREFTMPAKVYLLEQSPDDPVLVGGKAASLGRLLRAGVPVPPGFALSTDAFRAFLRANDLEGELTTRSESKHEEGIESDILARLRAARWPDDLRSKVEAAYAALRERSAGMPVAVRSSATVEDSAGASFAGQHATLLNLDGIDAVLDGIVTCWASLYSATALHYRRARGVADGSPAMAVVVQALVDAEASGVAFTLDPVSGDHDLVVIDAAWGLGEGVVSGIVSPDHFAVRKADGAIVRRALASKRVRVVSDAGGGTRTEELSGAQVQQPALSDERVVELARLAERIEKQMGAPQDIEWALAGGSLFILQARPITAAAGAPPEEWVSEFDTETAAQTVWTAANVQEVLPDQLSPFSCSINAKVIEEFGDEPIKRVGIRLKTKDPFFAFFYGRPFLNLTMMMEVADQSPFGSPEAVMHQFLGQRRDPNAKPERPSLGKLLRYAIVFPRMMLQFRRMPGDIRRSEQIIVQFEREDAARPFDQQSNEELVRTFDDGLLRGAEVSITHVSGGGITSSSFEGLGRLTERWLGDENGVLQARLCTGLSGVESAQPAYELWDLAGLVLRSDRLRRAFDPTDPSEIEQRLAAQQNDDIDAFRARLGEFLTHHGHRSVMEAEASARSWEEDLPTVFAMIRNYLHADPAADPRRIAERQRRTREQATKEALHRLRWWQRLIFRYALGQAQEWVVMREHTKSLMVRATNRGRRLTRELARRLVDRGLLDETWDFYDLTWDEARALVRGSLDRDEASAHIRRRKAEEERNSGVLLPEMFQGRPKPLRPSDMLLPDGDVLEGIAVSPGRVTGPARVILDPRQDAAIEPGEILVAPVTDAGWTPLFVVASGIVVDIGGSLSHGSTVAREYGLPAVVNVKHGTRMIRTGQMITVDGSRGVVVLNGS